MKKHSQMLKGLLGIIAGITLLLALALPAFAEQGVTLSVIVRDENSDPLKGAVFTLVSNVENDKTAYTSAASDENGMAVFTGLPQNGEFDLIQKSAPEGYLKDEHIYLITINNGSVYTLYDGELAEYETIAAENKKYTPYTVEVPFTVEVKQTGKKAPGKETFTINPIGDFFTQYEYIKIVSTTVETNGAGKFNGTLKFTVPQEHLVYLSDGFNIAQVKGNKEGWTYSDAIFCMVPELSLETDNGAAAITGFRIHAVTLKDGEYALGEEELNEACFINSYNMAEEEKPPVNNPDKTPVKENEKPKSPKTGDNAADFAITLMLTGIALGGVSIAFKKKHV